MAKQRQKGKDVKGTVYLVCLKVSESKFSIRSYFHAGHYVGFAEEGNLESRLEEHKKGIGSKLLRAARRYGIGFQCVRTWENGTRTLERALKNRHDARSLCPNCCADRRAAQMFSKAMKDLGGVKRIIWN